LRQGKLPPQALDAGEAALVLDRLPKLLIDGSHLGRGRRFAVPYARETEEVAGELRAARMEDEGPAHSQGAAEKTGFEDHVVSRRSLAGSRGSGCGWALGRPVVLSEHEGGEIDLMRELEEALQGGGPGIERSRPGFNVRDVCETAGQRLQQLLLLSRRAQEDARLVHPFLQDRVIETRTGMPRAASAFRNGSTGTHSSGGSTPRSLMRPSRSRLATIDGGKPVSRATAERGGRRCGRAVISWRVRSGPFASLPSTTTRRQSRSSTNGGGLGRAPRRPGGPSRGAMPGGPGARARSPRARGAVA